MYSTPNASRALAMAILVLVSKKAFANCSPSMDQWASLAKGIWTGEEFDEPRRVLSMILKFETLLRKSEARAAYGFLIFSSRACLALCAPSVCALFVPLAGAGVPFEMSTGIISEGLVGAASPLGCGHICFKRQGGRMWVW